MIFPVLRIKDTASDRAYRLHYGNCIQLSILQFRSIIVGSTFVWTESNSCRTLASSN